MRRKTIIAISSISVVVIASLLLTFLLNKPKEIILNSPNLSVNERDITNNVHPLVNDADFYISTDGDDSNIGDLNHPFKTLSKAKDAVSKLDKTGKSKVVVAIKSGDYSVSNFTLNSLDGGNDTCKIIYTSYGDGEVKFNSGINLKIEDFSHIQDEEIKNRLSDNCKDKILEISLNEYGISESDYGKLYARGFYCTAQYYDGDYIGPICGELFSDEGKRLTLARYPNGTNTINTNDIVESGKNLFNPGDRNPKGDTYRFSSELIQRFSKYDLNEAWIGGFKKYSWADESSPIESINIEENTLTTKFFGCYGADVHGEIFFYNVLEELDEPNEYFIDRTNNKLYFYPDENIKNVTLSVNNGYVLQLNNTQNVELSNITIKGNRSTGLIVSGSNNVIKNVTITSCGGSGLTINGNNNLIDKCIVKYMGQGGISVNGGDIETLTASNNIIQNSLIHHIGQIYQTVYSGISITGVGNKILHNEIFETPHTGILYDGNNNLISYNYLHQVCTNSSDAGAIYACRRWDCYGNIISNNCIFGVRNDKFSACGIYLDDGFSGQIVKNNYLIDVGFFSLCIGGGRDHQIVDNVIINLTGESINYDDRCRASILNDEEYSWFTHSFEGSDLWETLYQSNYKSKQWQETFEIYSKFSSNFNDIDNPYFFPNPANSQVSGNLIFNKSEEIGRISSSVYQFSSIKDNDIYKLKRAKRFFNDFSNGDYEFKDINLKNKYGCIKDIGIKF